MRETKTQVSVGTLPATGETGDSGEIPSFEFKLRVRGRKKSKTKHRERQVR